MSLRKLQPATGSTREKRRRGRGPGSGLGGSAGRGEKGYLARSGSGRKGGFEGGQLPIYRRLPKRGFKNIWGETAQPVNLRDLAKLPDGVAVEPETLKQAGLIRHATQPVKILGTGDVTRAYEVNACELSQSAREKIIAAGGKVA